MLIANHSDIHTRNRDIVDQRTSSTLMQQQKIVRFPSSPCIFFDYLIVLLTTSVKNIATMFVASIGNVMMLFAGCLIARARRGDHRRRDRIVG